MRRTPLARSRSIFQFLAILAIGPAVWGCSKSESKPAPTPPTLSIEDIRGGAGAKVTFPVKAQNLPKDTVAVEWNLDLRLRGVDTTSIRMGKAAPNNTRVSEERAANGAPGFHYRVEAEAGHTLSNGEIATISFVAPNRIVGRKLIRMPQAWALEKGGTRIALEADTQTVGISLISNPVTLFAFLAGCVAIIFWLSEVKAFKGFFRYFPALIWTYFVPMLCTTVGITPDASPLYSPFMSRIILPAVLVLLLIPSDVKGISRLGLKAVGVMLCGTLGIVLGAIGSFALFVSLFPHSIPAEAWKGIAALSGSWIGGSTNMIAVLEALSAPPSIVGPLVVVDTVLAYSWLGLLIALSAYQRAVDKYHKADSRVVDEISQHIEAEHEAHARDPRVVDIALMIGAAFVVSQVCLWFGGPLDEFVKNTLHWHLIAGVINGFGWGILLITGVALLLSFTPLRKLDYCGASSLGYVGLYLLLTSYGARANLKAVLEVPIFFGIGFVWILIHIAVLYGGIRLFKAPLFLGATSSMANIGGTASAPVVAAAYNQSMAPVGLLMAILGGVLGTPLALFVVATACRAISGG